MKKNLTIGLLLIFSITLIFSFANAKNSQQAWLGITTQTVDEELADAFALNVNYGAIVNEVIEDSPADKAKLFEGDVIIAFNSDKVYDYNDLLDFVEDSKPNETVALTVVRDDDTLNIGVTLEEAPADYYDRLDNKNTPQRLPNFPNIPSMPNFPNLDDAHMYNYNYSNASSAYIGVQVINLTDQLRTYFGIQKDKGVLVSEVEKDSPADKFGIIAGDIIIESDNNDISDYTDLKESIADKEDGDVVSITLMRNQNKKHINITVAEHKGSNRPFMNVPDISMQFPHGKRNMAISPDNLNELLDSKEFRDEIENLKKELGNLKVEMKQDMKTDDTPNNKELQTELQKLKKEIKALKNKIDD